MNHQEDELKYLPYAQYKFSDFGMESDLGMRFTQTTNSCTHKRTHSLNVPNHEPLK